MLINDILLDGSEGFDIRYSLRRFRSSKSLNVFIVYTNVSHIFYFFVSLLPFFHLLSGFPYLHLRCKGLESGLLSNLFSPVFISVGQLVSQCTCPACSE